MLLQIIFRLSHMGKYRKYDLKSDIASAHAPYFDESTDVEFDIRSHTKKNC